MANGALSAFQGVTSPLDRSAEPARRPLRIAFIAALIAHAGVAAIVLSAQRAQRALPSAVSATLAELIEIPVALEPAEPEPEPVREPEPQAPPRAVKAPRAQAAPAEAAPAAAQAAQVLAQAPDDAVLDFGETIVQGEATTYAGGVTEAGGSSRVAVRDGNARGGGVVGGRGTDTSGVDRSRPASLAGGAHWDCPFPEEADERDLDGALVTLRVRVSERGALEDVIVARDPGDGFGREARRCARDKRWQPARDASGRAIAAESLVNVRFSR
jgi:protein TonB